MPAGSGCWNGCRSGWWVYPCALWVIFRPVSSAGSVLFFSSAESTEVLGGYAEHAVPEDEVALNAVGEEMPANLQALFTRTLIFALSMVALLVVLW